MKNLKIILVLSAVAIFGFWFNQKNQKSFSKNSEPIQSASGNMNSSPTASSPASNSAEGAPPTESNPNSPSQESLKDSEFQAWLAKEAKTLDSPNVNAQDRKAEIARIVARLT